MSEQPPFDPKVDAPPLPGAPASDAFLLADAIRENLAQLKPGSLRFWANWFGKPHDNVHSIVGAQAFDDAIAIYFDQAETLTVDAPRDWSLDDGILLIRNAKRVRFQWYDYGQPPLPETLASNEYERPASEPSPAVELHG